MEEPILITWLNDYIFCPRSIYYHNLYGEKERLAYQEQAQIDGSKAHETVAMQYRQRMQTSVLMEAVRVLKELFDV